MIATAPHYELLAQHLNQNENDCIPGLELWIAKVEGRKVDGLKGDDAFIEHVEVGI